MGFNRLAIDFRIHVRKEGQRGSRFMRVTRVLAAALLASALGRGETSAQQNRSADAEARASTIITAQEIREASVATALEAVRLFHPEWLTPRGQGAFGYADASDIPIYLGTLQVGGAEALGRVTAASIASIRFINPQLATARWGEGHPFGAIQIIRWSGDAAEAVPAGAAGPPGMAVPGHSTRSPNQPGQSWGGRLVSGVAAAAVGAGLGYFASQVALGDWDEDSGKGEIHRSTWAAVGGASGFALGFSLPVWGRPPGSSEPLPYGGGRFEITGEEIREASFANALEAVQFLRPEWLIERGQEAFYDPTSDNIRVYLDNVQLGGVQDLAGISPAIVRSILFFNRQQATARWGTGHTHGAILVLTQD
jgi:hypothetical protein